MSSTTSQPAASSMFKFVLVPAKESEPVQEKTADTKGGLSDDALVKYAKEYFYELTGAKSRVDVLSKANPKERKMLAQQVRQQMKGSQLDDSAMDDDTLLDMIYRNQSQPSCDITALTIPVPGNQYHAVSLYAADQAKESGLVLNRRATDIVTACGHAIQANGGGIFGDVFLGRALDNEATDVWKRLDLLVSEAHATAEWCKIARSPGGGGGHGGKAAAASLSGLLQQQHPQTQPNQQPMQIMDTSAGKNDDNTALYGINGAPAVQETWGSWTQTNEEVEVVFQVEAGTKAKECQIQFWPKHFKVAVKGKTLLEKSPLFDPIVVDESTFTIQDSDDGKQRDLTVTLTKADRRTWSWLVEPSTS